MSDSGHLQAYFEVKTRTKSRRGHSRRYRSEPLSIYLTLRRYGPIDKVDELPELFSDLAQRADSLAAEILVPNLLAPIARQITSSNA